MWINVNQHQVSHLNIPASGRALPGLYGLAGLHHRLLEKGANASGFEPVALHGSAAIPSVCAYRMKHWLPELKVTIAAFLSDISMHELREPALLTFVGISDIVIRVI